MRANNIKDIAKYCNVGVSTVSRVLNDYPDVSEQTRAKVLAAIKELSFVPNNSARNLVRTIPKRIALIVRGSNNLFFSEMIKIIEGELYKNGFSVELLLIDTQDDEVAHAASLIREKNLIGVIFLGGRFNYTEEDMRPLHVPYVFCTYTNTFGTLSKNSFSSVAIDDKAEALRGVNYLIQNGHKHIAAIIPKSDDNSISQLRFEGYLKALCENNIEANYGLIEFSDDFSLNSSYNAAKRLIDKKIKFSALFTVSDVMAIGAVKALADNNLNVPKDCSVMGIDGLEIAKYFIPSITTLVQPADEMARISAKMLMDLIDNKQENTQIVFKTSVRKAQSVRPV